MGRGVVLPVSPQNIKLHRPHFDTLCIVIDPSAETLKMTTGEAIHSSSIQMPLLKQVEVSKIDV